MGYELKMIVGHLYTHTKGAIARRTSDHKYATVSGHRDGKSRGYDPSNESAPYGYESDGDTEVDLSRSTIIRNVYTMAVDAVFDLGKDYDSPLHKLHTNESVKGEEQVCLYDWDGDSIVVEDKYGKVLEVYEFEVVWNVIKAFIEDSEGNPKKTDHYRVNMAYALLKGMEPYADIWELKVAFYGY